MRTHRSATLLLLLAACGAAEPPAVLPGEIRHVLMISMDTTRADHLGSYGDSRGLTPNLDALATRSVRFAAVTSPAPTTLAAHCSIMTGSYPQTHGVARNGFTLNEENVTLAELFAEQGWHTAAVLGSFALDSRFQFDQGFQFFDESFEMGVEGGRDQNQRSARFVTDAALSHFDRAKAQRSFTFVHYFDPHVPYEAPAEFARQTGVPEGQQRIVDADIERRVMALQAKILPKGLGLSAVIGGGLPPLLLERADGEPDAEDLAFGAAYAAEVAFMDHEIGRLLEGLQTRGLLANTLVVLTGDHGETFWEHGDFWNHGLWLHQTSVHVPLLLAFPDGRGAGSVVDDLVSTVDLLPTLAELFGLEMPERAEGISLLAAVDGGALSERAIFSVATQPGAILESKDLLWTNAAKPHSVRKGPWKLVLAPYLENYQQLFHLGRDPGEQKNLLRAPLGPAAQAALADLRAELSAFRGSARPLASGFDRSQYEDTVKRLAGLGYLGAEDEEAGSK